MLPLMSRNGHLKNAKYHRPAWKTAICDSANEFESATKDLLWFKMELRIINLPVQKDSPIFWKGQMTPADVRKLVKISAAVKKRLK